MADSIPVRIAARYIHDREGSETQVGWDVFLRPHTGGPERKVGFFTPGYSRFYTWRDEVRHYSRVAQGYGIDKALVDLFDRSNTLDTIALTVRRENGSLQTYFTTVIAWLFNAEEKTLSEEWGPQFFLTLRQLEEFDRVYRANAQRAPSLSVPYQVQLELPV